MVVSQHPRFSRHAGAAPLHVSQRLKGVEGAAPSLRVEGRSMTDDKAKSHEERRC